MRISDLQWIGLVADLLHKLGREQQPSGEVDCVKLPCERQPPISKQLLADGKLTKTKALERALLVEAQLSNILFPV
ncbi:hypothetical protein T11_16588 [Trichinella zimbabwensis]|uniref:Uncharacterized protein n=1 Tax=Trichinella zimbabwensis TaxID=268475 RepID=A0A0V1GT95_9BILA|nr:hypothetical protein T11_16588 [Trichinella zimbabwensis]